MEIFGKLSWVSEMKRKAITFAKQAWTRRSFVISLCNILNKKGIAIVESAANNINSHNNPFLVKEGYLFRGMRRRSHDR